MRKALLVFFFVLDVVVVISARGTVDEHFMPLIPKPSSQKKNGILFFFKSETNPKFYNFTRQTITSSYFRKEKSQAAHRSLRLNSRVKATT